MENTGQGSIFIGAGANLSHPIHGAPRPTLEAAFAELGRRGVEVVRVSPWYRTAPVPASDQPWYVNAVAEVVTKLAPDRLLAVLGRAGRSVQRDGEVVTDPIQSRAVLRETVRQMVDERMPLLERLRITAR